MAIIRPVHGHASPSLFELPFAGGPPRRGNDGAALAHASAGVGWVVVPPIVDHDFMHFWKAASAFSIVVLP